MNKSLKVMTSAALLAGVVAPVAVDTVSANSSNIVSKVKKIADDYDWEDVLDSGDTVADVDTPTTSIYINEDDVDFTSGDSFRLSLPSDVEWIKDKYEQLQDDNGYIASNTTGDAQYHLVSITDTDLELRMVGSSFGDGDESAKVEVPLYFKVDGADEGEVKLTIDGLDSTISSGSYTIAVINDGDTSTTIADVKTIGDGDEIDTIRIDESSAGAIYASGTQEIKLKLPSKFEWVDSSVDTDNITLGGGFNSSNVNIVSFDNDEDADEAVLVIETTSPSQSAGTIYIEGLKINADNDANYGEIEVDIDGDEVTSESLVVAEYADYGTTASLEDDVPTLIAGRNNDDIDDLETVEFELKETTPGSWLPGRSVNMEFPSWVKVVGFDVTDYDNFTSAEATDIVDAIEDEIDGDDNVIEFDMPDFTSDSGKKSLTLKFYVSTEADASGDVTVAVDGRAGVELSETVIAEVVSPIDVEVEKADVRTGIQNQEINNIVITENVAGAFDEDGKVVEIWLPDDVEFSDDPTIEVVEGNLEIDEDSINVDDNVLTFEIDSESTRASKIEISGLALDLDRSVPEGDITVKVGGEAIVQNYAGDSSSESPVYNGGENPIGDKDYGSDDDAFDLDGTIDVGEFDKEYAFKGVIATVVTPAEGNATVEEATFTIGSTTYKIGDVEKVMDVAPFVEGGRTFMPVRYVADAVGVSEENILWDQTTQTATFIKDGRVAQVTVGSNTLKVNGAEIAMDAAAQVKDGRTVIPVRFVAQALGAEVDWNQADQTVTVK